MPIREYAVTNDLVLFAVTGEVGSGKTTLVRNLLNQLGESHTAGLGSDTHYAFENLKDEDAARLAARIGGKVIGPGRDGG